MLKVRTGEIRLNNLQFEEVFIMKKPIIIWIVAALFLFCSIPFFGQGSIVEGICGIAIAAVLGVFGYLTMKRTQAAAEAERERVEAEAKRKAEEEARRKEYAETHEFLTCPVAGVTFDNHQRLLASLYRDSEGVGIDGSLEECEYEGAPAVRVIAEGDMIGYIRKSDLRKVLPILERVEDVTITIDNFDDDGSKVYNAEAHIVYHI